MKEQDYKNLREYLSAEKDKNKGWIHITGIGVMRAISIEGEHIPVEQSRKAWPHSTEFNWGYGGSGPAQLALAILLLYLPDRDAIKHHQLLKQTMVAILPQQSFYIRFDMGAWLNKVMNLTEPNPRYKVHAYSFMEIGIKTEDGVYYFTKFLDLPHLPLKSGSFSPDTVEYAAIKKIEADGKLTLYRVYLRAYTDTGNGYMELLEDTGNCCFVFYNGLGSNENYAGHKKLEFYDTTK